MDEVKIAQFRGDSTELPRLNALIAQLSNSAPPLTHADLHRLLSAHGTTVFAAYAGKDLIGILSLIIAIIPTGAKAYIEDVVVDEKYRGRGIARALTLKAIARCNEMGVRMIDLTSRPDRIAANELYKNLGFQQRATNVYRLQLAGKSAPQN